MEDSLQHVGVKGMKWGVRNPKAIKTHLENIHKNSINKKDLTGRWYNESYSRNLKKYKGNHLRAIEGARQELGGMIDPHWRETMFKNLYKQYQTGMTLQPKIKDSIKQGGEGMSNNLEDVLTHVGVKGMKWGHHKAGTGASLTPDAGGKKLKVLEAQMKVTKDPAKLKELQTKYGKIEDSINYSKPKNGPSKLAQVKDGVTARVNSVKRQNDWKKLLKNLDNMSTKDIQAHATRIQLENELRRLSKRKGLIKDKGIGTKQDRLDYLKRANMSNAELLQKVGRLRAKSALLNSINDANRTQQEMGKQVVKATASLGAKYVLTGKVSVKDVANVAANTKGAYGQTRADLIRTNIDKIPDKTILKRKTKV